MILGIKIINLIMLIPFIGGLLAFLINSNFIRRALLILVAFFHLSLTIVLWFLPIKTPNGEWFSLDYLGLFFLTIASLLFAISSLYGIAYLKKEEKHIQYNENKRFLFKNSPENIFIGCLLFFLGTMSVVVSTQHFGILWIAIEATTLFSAPLIYFHRNSHSLEATWKYLLICSVGIALALLGNLFLALSNSNPHTPFLVSKFMEVGPKLNLEYLKIAFILFFIGYGTKMGLVPLHTWLPDAHSEAPSIVSSLLSGALLNCAFLSLLRIYQVCIAANFTAFPREIFLIFGLLSIIIATFFIVKQKNYKRMLAYSSIENMGILAVGIGIGGGAVFGSLFHAFNHSLTKGALFLISGNILSKYNTKQISSVTGLNQTLPFSGILWILGFFSITGTPPFGTFISKFLILQSIIDQGHWVIAFVMLTFFVTIFIGMAIIFLSMFQKKDTSSKIETRKEPLLLVLGPTILIIIILTLGIYPFPFLENLLTNAASLLKVLP